MNAKGCLKLSCVLVVSLFLGLLGFLSQSISPHFTTARYVIEVGCRGHINVIPNQADGVSVQYVNGAYLFLIPKNGTLKLRYDDPTRNSSVDMSASFTDGTPIAMPIPTATNWKKGQLGFIPGGTWGSGKSDYFLGTREDYEKVFWKLP